MRTLNDTQKLARLVLADVRQEYEEALRDEIEKGGEPADISSHRGHLKAIDYMTTAMLGWEGIMEQMKDLYLNLRGISERWE